MGDKSPKKKKKWSIVNYGNDEKLSSSISQLVEHSKILDEDDNVTVKKNEMNDNESRKKKRKSLLEDRIGKELNSSTSTHAEHSDSLDENYNGTVIDNFSDNNEPPEKRKKSVLKDGIEELISSAPEHIECDKSLNGDDNGVISNSNSLANKEISSIDFILLRKKLKEDTALQACRLLLSASRESHFDAIAEYIKAGGGPLELLKVINTANIKKDPASSSPVFSVVHLVLMKILSSFPLLQKSAEEACCYLLREHIPTIHLMLAPSASVNHKLVALKLLTSIASVNTLLAKDVLNSVNLEYEKITHFTAQVSPSDIKNIRITFIHFILGFIVEGNFYVIRQLFQNKGLLRLVLQDSIFDNHKTITFLLTALRDKVVSNTMLTKSLKLNIFNTSVLISLLELYNWLGPSHWRKNRVQTEDRATTVFKGDEGQRKAVRDTVHSLLILLCTSHKLGIVFIDKSMGTGHCQNSIILTLLKTVINYWHDVLVRELIELILHANPDLVSYTFKKFESLFEPCNTSKWFASLDFINKVIEKLDPKTCLQDDLSVQQLTKMTTQLCLPPSVLRTVCSEAGFKNEEFSVRKAVVKCFVTCLKKLHEFIMAAHLPDSTIVSAVIKHLNTVGPRVEWIIAAWQMGSGATLDRTLDYHVDFIEVVTLLIKISRDTIDSDHIEDLVTTSFNELLKIENDDKHDLFKLESIKMLTLLTSLAPTDVTFSTCIRLLCQQLRTNFKEDAKIVLTNLLLSTEFMEGVDDEVEIWVNALMRDDFNNDVIVDFFLEIIKNGYCEITSHFKTITAACESDLVHDHQTSNIDVLLAMLQENGGKDDIKSNAMQMQYCVSPLVPAMLHLLKIDKSKTEITNKKLRLKQKFVSVVLVYCLHKQVSPLRLHNIMENYSLDIPAAGYIASWSKAGIVPHSLTFPPFGSDCIESKLSNLFLEPKGSTELKNEIILLLESSTNYSAQLILHLCIFYITQLYQRKELTLDSVESSKIIINSLLNVVDYSSQSFASTLQGIFKHPVVVDMFQPLKTNICSGLVEIVLAFVRVANKVYQTNNYILLPCKNRLINTTVKALERHKKMKSSNLVNAIQEFTLSDEDINLLITDLVKLPFSALEDGWLEVEASLLKQAAVNSIIISREVFNLISKQLMLLNGGPILLQNGFIEYVKRFPHFLDYTEIDLFKVLVSECKRTKTNINLAKLLLSCDKRLISVFQENIVKVPSILFPLLSVIDDFSVLDKNVLSETLLKVLEKGHLEKGIIVQAPWLIEYTETIAYLLENFVEANKKKKVYESLRTNWNDVPFNPKVLIVLKSLVVGTKFEVDFVGKLFIWITEKINSKCLERCDWLYNCISDIFSSTNTNVNWTKLKQNGEFDKVIYLSLKWGLDSNFEDCISLMKMLCIVCSTVFTGQDKDMISELFNRAISHSNFVNVMLDSGDLTCQSAQLLLILLKINPTMAASSHIPIYLSAYGATLSSRDQTLLELLQFYECNGVRLSEFLPCLWGPTAANYYSVYSNSTQPLWRRPHMSKVLNLLDKKIVDTTIAKLPLDRSLQASDHTIIENGEKIYDITFLLPLFACLLQEGADVNHRLMISSGALAITIASLSSSSLSVRQLAYLVFIRFRSHLSSEKNDQKLWLNFIDVIQRGVLEMSEYSPKISTLVTVFLARATMVLSFPEDPLFNVLYNFTLAKPTLTLNSIPAFLELLQSKEIQLREHQKWILNVIRDGTRQNSDLKLLFHDMAFKILMAFYSFAHTPSNLKILIAEVFAACISVQDGGYLLVSHYGLLSWMGHTLRNKSFDETSLILLSENIARFNSHSLHVKLILISLLPHITKVEDVYNTLKILGTKKIITKLTKEDVQNIIQFVETSLGANNAQKAKDMFVFGNHHMRDIHDTNPNTVLLNKLIYDWLNTR